MFLCFLRFSCWLIFATKLVNFSNRPMFYSFLFYQQYCSRFFCSLCRISLASHCGSTTLSHCPHKRMCAMKSSVGRRVSAKSVYESFWAMMVCSVSPSDGMCSSSMRVCRVRLSLMMLFTDSVDTIQFWMVSTLSVRLRYIWSFIAVTFVAVDDNSEKCLLWLLFFVPYSCL